MDPNLIKAPLRLERAAVKRTYRGGGLLAKLYGQTDSIMDSYYPEEWISSVVSVRCSSSELPEGFCDEGLSRIAEYNDLTLKDVINQFPEEMLGIRHSIEYGSNLGVLAKLIDSAERLTIQVHPDREHAKKYFHSNFGKTECWYFLGGRKILDKPSCVYIGFKKGISKQKWEKLINEQDYDGLLNCLHKFNIQAGETVLVEAGTPHAIGAGCLLIEIQEPTDFTIRVEETTPSGLHLSRETCYQGISFESMLDCFQYDTATREETRRKCFITGSQLEGEGYRIETIIDGKHTSCFSLYLLQIYDTFELIKQESFYGLYILNGEGKMICGQTCERISSMQQYFVPAQTDKVQFINLSSGICELEIILFYGPRNNIKLP